MQAIDRAKARAQQKRQHAADAERAYALFLEEIATPTTRQLANVLKAEGYLFTVSTPSSGLRLASDRTRDDYVELDASGTRADRGRSRMNDRSSLARRRRNSPKPTSSCFWLRLSSPGWKGKSTSGGPDRYMNRHQSTK